MAGWWLSGLIASENTFKFESQRLSWLNPRPDRFFKPAAFVNWRLRSFCHECTNELTIQILNTSLKSLLFVHSWLKQSLAAARRFHLARRRSPSVKSGYRKGSFTICHEFTKGGKLRKTKKPDDMPGMKIYAVKGITGTSKQRPYAQSRPSRLWLKSKCHFFSHSKI